MNEYFKIYPDRMHHALRAALGIVLLNLGYVASSVALKTEEVYSYLFMTTGFMLVVGGGLLAVANFYFYFHSEPILVGHKEYMQKDGTVIPVDDIEAIHHENTRFSDHILIVSKSGVERVNIKPANINPHHVAGIFKHSYPHIPFTQ